MKKVDLNRYELDGEYGMELWIREDAQMYTECNVRLMEVVAPAEKEEVYWKEVYRRYASSETELVE
jgi:hypothetical protein